MLRTSVLLTLIILPAFAWAIGEPRVEYFRAVPQSAAYVGDADADGAPDLLVNKAVEFELLVCDTEGAGVYGKVQLGDGTTRALASIPCDPLKFPYSYKQPAQDLIAILDVRNELGRTTVAALKLDIVAEPPDEPANFDDTQSLEPPVLGPLVNVNNAPPQGSAENPTSGQPSVTKNLIQKGASVTASDSDSPAPQGAQVSAASEGSPIMGAIITGGLALLFLVLFVSLLRATFFK